MFNTCWWFSAHWRTSPGLEDLLSSALINFYWCLFRSRKFLISIDSSSRCSVRWFQKKPYTDYYYLAYVPRRICCHCALYTFMGWQHFTNVAVSSGSTYPRDTWGQRIGKAGVLILVCLNQAHDFTGCLTFSQPNRSAVLRNVLFYTAFHEHFEYLKN